MPLAEMKLPAPVTPTPIVLELAPPATHTPLAPLPRPVVPSAVRPMKSPWTTLLVVPPPTMWTPYQLCPERRWRPPRGRPMMLPLARLTMYTPLTLGRACARVESVPMWSPTTRLLVAPPSVIYTPLEPLPEMTSPEPGTGPP